MKPGKYFAIVYNHDTGLWEDSGLPDDVLEVLAGEVMSTRHNEQPALMSTPDVMESDQDRQAWDEDEADMARIAREWDEFDRDPPGS